MCFVLAHFFALAHSQASEAAFNAGTKWGAVERAAIAAQVVELNKIIKAGSQTAAVLNQCMKVPVE